MRKIVSMIIVVAIICLGPSVCADGNTANQIKFRDFDFGVSIDQLEESFNQPKVHTYTNEEALSPYWSTLKSNMFVVSAPSYYTGWSVLSASYDNGINVAGYDVSDVYMYAHYGIDQNGKLLREKENSVFYLGVYYFNVIDIPSAYKDLREKLTSLYGSSDEITDSGDIFFAGVNGSGSYTVYTSMSEWNDDDGGAIKLISSTTNDEKNGAMETYLILAYGDTNADKTIDQIAEIVKQEMIAEEAGNRSNSMNGL